eukprot:3941946-Rhodomonas_salina.7
MRTDRAYGAIRRRRSYGSLQPKFWYAPVPAYAMPSTDIAHALQASVYEMCGTDIACAATRKRSCKRLPRVERYALRLHREIQYKKLHFQYNLYQECGFLYLIRGACDVRGSTVLVYFSPKSVVSSAGPGAPARPQTQIKCKKPQNQNNLHQKCGLMCWVLACLHAFCDGCLSVFLRRICNARTAYALCEVPYYDTVAHGVGLCDIRY